RNVARRGIGADQPQEIGEPGATESSNHVPAFHAYMPRVLAIARQRLHLRQCVFSGFLYRAADGQRPVLEDHARIIDVIAVDGKLRKWSEVGIVESGRQMAGAEHPGRGPIAETQALLQQTLLELREGEGSQRKHGCELEQFPAADLPELFFIHFAIVVLHEMTCKNFPPSQPWDSRDARKFRPGSV